MTERRFPNRQFIIDAANWRGLRIVGRDLLHRGRSDYFWHLNKQAYRRRLGAASSHPTAARVKAAFPEEWESYFKFAIVRNPFSVAVSSWRQRYAKRQGDYYSFDEYIRAWADRDTRWEDLPLRNWDLVAVDNHVELDLVLRFESLERDVATLSSRLGHAIVMPVVNSGAEPTAHRELFDRQTRAIAERMFARELNEFGYDF